MAPLRGRMFGGFPGDQVVHQGCKNACAACELCGVLERGPARAHDFPGVQLWEVIEDPDDRPYIWDLED